MRCSYLPYYCIAMIVFSNLLPIFSFNWLLGKLLTRWVHLVEWTWIGLVAWTCSRVGLGIFILFLDEGGCGQIWMIGSACKNNDLLLTVCSFFKTPKNRVPSANRVHLCKSPSIKSRNEMCMRYARLPPRGDSSVESINERCTRCAQFAPAATWFDS
jgi:hypothetical protein